MPYFSFKIDENKIFREYENLQNHLINTKYYSKNTKLWSKLNKLKKKHLKITLNKEKREAFNKNYRSILFCLPPNIGLGDSIEYGLSIKAFLNQYRNIKVGVAHVGIYREFLKNSSA